MSRFVRPETATLTLANGDTLVVKQRLNRGEQAACFARMYAARADGAPTVNALQVGLAVVAAYLLDWSLCDDAGAPVVIRDRSTSELERVLDNLSPEDFEEIRDAIDAHVSAMEQARAAIKNPPGGTSTSATISPSPSAADGPSPTFEPSPTTSTTSS